VAGRERPLTSLEYERTNRRLVRKLALLTMTVQNGVRIREWHGFLRNLRTLIDDVLSYDLPDTIVVQVVNPLEGWPEESIMEAQPPVPDTLPEEWT